MNFHIEDDTLTVTLDSGEAFWALKRKLVVPKVNIERITWKEQFITTRRQLGFRVGTLLPGRLFAGRYYAHDGANFLYLIRPQGLFGDIKANHVLVVELRDFAYRRLLLTVDDPDMAEQIIAWWSGNV
jgi:hypothetical protein